MIEKVKNRQNILGENPDNINLVDCSSMDTLVRSSYNKLRYTFIKELLKL